MMLWIDIAFLGIALFLYCLLGGADFGAGALEVFVSKRNRRRHEELVNKAMGPVWEANHIWLILLIVILFNAFPKVYTEYSIYFHVPLTLMLLGIVFRGCAFSFRNYDVVKDPAHRYYSKAFGLSSILTPIMFGMIMGGMFYGVNPDAPGYYGKYMASWFNLPSLMVGLFVLSIFTYLSSVYLVGETPDPAVKGYYLRCARNAGMLMMAAGALVFIFAQASARPLFKVFFTNPVSGVCFVLATLLSLDFWKDIKRRRTGEWRIRVIAGLQLMMILTAWAAVIFPNVLFYVNGTALSLFNASSPAMTVDILGWALIGGSIIFVPILFYLIRIFKTPSV